MKTLVKFGCVAAVVGACALVQAAGMALAKMPTLVDLPVSVTNNPMCLSSMADRPWWNREWTRRAPILVSATAKVNDENAIVDAIVDFGEEVMPEDVRVITPWETVVDSVCAKVRRTALRLIFRTRLRAEENKPFLVYWNRQGGGVSATKDGASLFSSLQMRVDDDEVRIANGVLDVTFDNRHATGGLVKALRVIASTSANELLTRASGYAWQGIAFKVGRPPMWKKAEVLLDTPLVKEIRFASDRATVDFRLYEGAPRVDYRCRLHGYDRLNIDTAWAAGDRCNDDDFFYPSAAGKILTYRASLDHATDWAKLPPQRDFQNWLGAGWYAIRDRKRGNVVAQFFDRTALENFMYDGDGRHVGEGCWLRFVLGGSEKESRSDLTGVSSGAFVALHGTVEEVRREYELVSHPPRVFVGAAESRREIPVKCPDLIHDFIADYNLGQGSGNGLEAEPLLADPGWASNCVDRLRELGANVWEFNGYHYAHVPITKAQYDEAAAIRKAANHTRHFPPWDDATWARNVAEHRRAVDAAHAKGLSVFGWTDAAAALGIGRFSPRTRALDLAIQNLYPQLGYDAIFNACFCMEGYHFPDELLKKYGRNYWDCPHPEEFFADVDEKNRFAREFYDGCKRLSPGVPVFLWNSEQGDLNREVFATEQIGAFDSTIVEMLPGADVPHVKHVARRMRGLLGNTDGLTVYNHFFYFLPSAKARVNELERPFVFGVNGFSQENFSYYANGREQIESTADFYRFAEYTKLGEKVAKMGPVKNVAVFRDNVCFRADILKKRIGRPYANQARQDGLVHAFCSLRNFNADIVHNAHFRADSLKRYNVVYIPEDPEFSEDLAKELLAYVRAGGGAVVEGVTGEKVMEKVKKLGEGEQWNCSPSKKDESSAVHLGSSPSPLVLDTPTPCGKGKILWTKEVLSENVGRYEGKIRQAIADVGGRDPYTLDSSAFDSMLQAGPDGMFLGVCNVRDVAATGTVTLCQGEDALTTRGKSVPALAEGKSDSMCQGEDALATKPLFVLDVRAGTRVPLTNNTFSVSAGPQQCGFYLIGDDAFTAVPSVREADWRGPLLYAHNPRGVLPTCEVPTNFVPVRAVEFTADWKGTPDYAFRRSSDAAIVCTRFSKARYRRPAFCEALETATYLHLNAPDNEGDVLFAENAAELKAFLARGGAIFFDRVLPGPKARAFLASVGACDAAGSMAKVEIKGRADLSADAPTNHAFAVYAQAFPDGHPTGTFEIMKGVGFVNWDRTRQSALYFSNEGRGRYAMTLTEDGVLGKGRIAYNLNVWSFSDWYEDRKYGDALLTWLVGRDVKEHAGLVLRQNGGPGKCADELKY